MMTFPPESSSSPTLRGLILGKVEGDQTYTDTEDNIVHFYSRKPFGQPDPNNKFDDPISICHGPLPSAQHGGTEGGDGDGASAVYKIVPSRDAIDAWTIVGTDHWRPQHYRCEIRMEIGTDHDPRGRGWTFEFEGPDRRKYVTSRCNCRRNHYARKRKRAQCGWETAEELGGTTFW